MAVNRELLSACAPLREALHRTEYTADALLEMLGADAHDALGRSEPVPVRLASRTAGDLGVLTRLFLLADPCPAAEVAHALRPLDLDRAVAVGLLERSGDEVRAALDLRPLDLGSGNRWVLSDLDGSMGPRTTAPDHVLGVGHASLSLLRATPTTPTGSVLDLGTGCGIQAMHAAGYARSVTATDINLRALDLSAATFALNEIDVELLGGPWFEPVVGRRFDRVVANPPFVVGRGRVEHTYRDSGLDLDGASELMISNVLDHLEPGGTASMLASWVHVRGEDWRSRIASWLPAHGVDAWIVQRDVADPALYVGTWMRDGGLDPRDPATAAQAEAWLAHFEAADVEGVGFGFVYLRRTDEPSDVLAEDLRHGFTDPLGGEALGYFDRLAWLRERDVLEQRFMLEPTTALERVSLPGEEGWQQVVARVHRGSGPNWQHEVDDLTAALLGGMRPDSLALNELLELLAAANGEDPDELAVAAVPLVHSLVRHGLVLPAEFPR
ncbi:Methyltransferase small domain-containing protein [Rhodococcus maanshanensis]|uniref:Methyltransferase small domain-containing protein n=1 Tax=Rhodococcus maanshanensis TaxID=183556 RepID=A0A1H7XGU8_9NOCA|nr:Methyltransferase small domain-containing protein [Rhodococcus maanshanensis]